MAKSSKKIATRSSKKASAPVPAEVVPMDAGTTGASQVLVDKHLRRSN